jgi:hypothetical protein
MSIWVTYLLFGGVGFALGYIWSKICSVDSDYGRGSRDGYSDGYKDGYVMGGAHERVKIFGPHIPEESGPETLPRR